MKKFSQMKKFSEWINEFSAVPGGGMPDKPKFRTAQSSLEKLTPKMEPQTVGGGEQKPEYDPREEELYGELIHALQDLLNVMDWDRTDAKAIKKGLSDITNTGSVYIDFLER